ncbi:MAG TPA: hypothetical protein VN739_03025 [Nitrososphaerales archaeon]|nr:hypothetical protein [Nitrososphaerales archaeon]
MSATKEDAEKNLKAFLKEHGREGLLELFLTNYLFELVMYYLHSEKNKPAVNDDTAYRFYVDGRDRVYPAEKIEAFKRELRTECRKKAVAIVTIIKEKELLDKLEREILEDPQIAQLASAAFQSMVSGS